MSPSSQEKAILDRHTKKHLVNQWQTFEENTTPYSVLVVSPAQSLGFGQTVQTQTAQHNAPQNLSPQLGPQVAQSLSPQIGQQPVPQQLASQIGPQIGPHIGPSAAAPTRVFAVANQSATDTEIVIGKYLLQELEDEQVVKVECASELKNSRSGDYRLYYRNGNVLPADLYECGTTNTQNAVSYIQSKWDQADTIVVLLPKNYTLNLHQVIAQLQQSSAPTSSGHRIIPRRVLFIEPNPIPGLPPEFGFKRIMLHNFYSDPQKSLFKLQL